MDKVLICGVNWLGDGIMSMPAIDLYKIKNPDAHVSVLMKKNMIPLWKMCNAVDDIIELEEGLTGTLRTAEKLSRLGFARSYVFPNSFRSALIPFMAGVPFRRGVAGHKRSIMLNSLVSADAAGKHQSWEYAEILQVTKDDGELELPMLDYKPDGVKVRKKHLGDFEAERSVVGIFPGAAYGPSKMWPAEYFISVGKKLTEDHKCHVLILGTDAERDVCMRVSEEIGDASVCLAGETTLPESALLLSDCSVVVCNDSGGMHLAAAVGTPLVAVYGITDPSKTGPMGKNHKVIQAEGVECNRDLDRDSPEAIEALKSIKPEEVYEAAVELLK